VLESLEILKVSLRAAEELLTQALQLDHAERLGHNALRPEWTPLKCIVQDQCLQDNALPVHVDSTVDLDVAFLDRLAISRILSTFVSNGTRFHPESSAEPLQLRVLLDTLSPAYGMKQSEMLWPDQDPLVAGESVSARALVIEVEDRGPGVPESSWASLFLPFSGVDDTTDVAGLGVGLAMCRSLARAMGGLVGFSPPEDGKSGAVFFVALPVCCKREASLAESTVPPLRSWRDPVLGGRTPPLDWQRFGHTAPAEGAAEEGFWKRAFWKGAPAVMTSSASPRSGSEVSDAARSVSVATADDAPRRTREAREARRKARAAQRIADTIGSSSVDSTSTVLLVEDVVSTRVMMARTLRRLRANVLEAEDGKKALELLRSFTTGYQRRGAVNPRCPSGVTLVVLDKDMPVSGFWFLDELNKMKASSDAIEAAMSSVRVVGCTAHGVPETIQGFLSRGAVDVLLKPASSADFYNVLSTAAEIAATPPPLPQARSIAASSVAVEVATADGD
jgi:CheY-like chemotaxis protein